jgi:hypothetical protein
MWRAAAQHRTRHKELTFEAQVRLDRELDALGAQPLRQGVELAERERQAKVGHRHRIAVDGVRGPRRHVPRHVVRHYLMAGQAEVNPCGCAAALGAAQHPAAQRDRRGRSAAGEGGGRGAEDNSKTGLQAHALRVKLPRNLQVAHGERQMEGAAHISFLRSLVIVCFFAAEWREGGQHDDVQSFLFHS